MSDGNEQVSVDVHAEAKRRKAVFEELGSRWEEGRCIRCGDATSILPMGFGIQIPFPSGCRFTSLKLCDKCGDEVARFLAPNNQVRVEGRR